MVDGFNFDDLPEVEETDTDFLIQQGVITQEDLKDAFEEFGPLDRGVVATVESETGAPLVDETFRNSPERALEVLEEALHWSQAKRQDLADEIRAELEEDAIQSKDAALSLEDLEGMDSDEILMFAKVRAQAAIEVTKKAREM